MMKGTVRLAFSCCLLHPLVSSALDLKHGTIPVQVGFFAPNQGQSQNVDIQGLIGNQYTVNHNQGTNGLVGVGYFVDGLEKDRVQLSYGLNGYYFGPASVTGTIIQEHLFTNLAYRYQIQNTPIYFAAKAKVKNNSEKYNIIFDAGIGPNFMRTSQYTEASLTDYSVAASNSFASKNNVAFTAMGGVGLRLNNVFGKAPVECGYRFFYLGQGRLGINNNQILNAIKTGDTYANALVCSVNV